MAESSLSIAYTELRQEVGFYLGYGRNPNNWTTDQSDEVDAVVQSGVRQVYYPPGVIQGAEGYEWSFLRPSQTLALVQDDADYDLPDDFGRMVGRIHFAPDTHYSPAVIISIEAIQDLQSAGDTSATPKYAAVRPKASDGASGQRWELMVWPKPDAAYTVHYQYEAYAGKLTDSYPYPLGGMKLSELYIESCLRIAEQRLNDQRGVHDAEFARLLADAIARDRKRGPHYYGPMGHYEDTEESRRPRGWTGTPYPVTYKGETV